jgi:hypothetical protein
MSTRSAFFNVNCLPFDYDPDAASVGRISMQRRPTSALLRQPAKRVIQIHDRAGDTLGLLFIYHL